MINSILALIFSMAVRPSGALASKPTEYQVKDNKVEFLTVGRPSAIKIRGEGAKLQGTLKIEGRVASGHLTFDLECLDTGIEMRNEHMKRKYLDTANFKEADLEIKQLKIPDEFFKNESPVALPVDGVLTLHGVKRPILGTASVQLKGSQLSGTVAFDLKLSDYKIEIPSYLGIVVADLVKIDVALLATEKRN